MNIFKSLLGAKADKPSGGERIAREMLPEVNAFVEVAIGDARERQPIPVDEISSDGFITRALAGMQPGATVDFLYNNPSGKFRFATTCVRVADRQAHFAMPADIRTIASYAAKRTAVRLESMLSVQWRYAVDGKGNGDYMKGSMCDLSRGGASLVVARELRKGTQLEIRFTLASSPEPLVVLSEVMRASKIQPGNLKAQANVKSSAGLRFLNVSNAGINAINQYIHGLQAERRDRGVV